MNGTIPSRIQIPSDIIKITIRTYVCTYLIISIHRSHHIAMKAVISIYLSIHLSLASYRIFSYLILDVSRYVYLSSYIYGIQLSFYYCYYFLLDSERDGLEMGIILVT
ncbi:hypothetical protein M432DRAFT_469179 [Thermoascus aurantiacus ATCC 26904]